MQSKCKSQIVSLCSLHISTFKLKFAFPTARWILQLVSHKCIKFTKSDWSFWLLKKHHLIFPLLSLISHQNAGHQAHLLVLLSYSLQLFSSHILPPLQSLFLSVVSDSCLGFRDFTMITVSYLVYVLLVWPFFHSFCTLRPNPTILLPNLFNSLSPIELCTNFFPKHSSPSYELPSNCFFNFIYHSILYGYSKFQPKHTSHNYLGKLWASAHTRLGSCHFHYLKLSFLPITAN